MGMSINHAMCVSRMADYGGDNFNVEYAKRVVKDLHNMPLCNVSGSEAEMVFEAYDTIEREFDISIRVMEDYDFTFEPREICYEDIAIKSEEEIEVIMQRLEELTDKYIVDSHRKFFKSDNVLKKEYVDIRVY